ncbi:MAG: hypothetical protein Q7U53_02090 [Anaerolineaceae bacterium]|nr:hypothetical protein [Anaerolineaceae bacterium]
MEKMTRRDLLKAIVAGSGGIVAAGFLPEKWLKPVVKSGVLPVHAQASAPQPTTVPDQNYIEGYGYWGDGYLFADAFVSAVPFVYPGAVTNVQNPYKLASPAKIPLPTDQPVEGVEVTLLINGVPNSEKKTTDVNGYVEWQIQYSEPDDLTLRFEIEGDFDEWEVSGLIG